MIGRSGNEKVSGVDGQALGGEPRVLWRNEDEGIDTLRVAFEGSDAGTVLVALVQLWGVEDPGLDGLVVGGGEDEVSRH